MQKYILTILVKNNAGVLARVTSLFGRRGYNIDSLTVSPTNNPKFSRIVLVAIGDDYILSQIIKQVQKLEEVMTIEHLPEKGSFCKELLFVRLKTSAEEVSTIYEIADLYNAKPIEDAISTVTLQLTDKPSRIDAFLNVIGNYEITEMCRTGITAMKKSDIKNR